MNEIRMVDLNKQYLDLKSDIDNAVMDVMHSSAFINGKPVKQFAAELSDYLSVDHVISCANGTDALQIALMALELKPNDEIIVPDFTFISTIETVALLGLKPVIADILPETFNIDPLAVENAITNKTKAIIPVHLFGQCADMYSIMKIAQKHGLYVIEDAAQALGSSYAMNNQPAKKAGTIGTIGCTSFFPSKNLGAYGDGGAIFTGDEKLAEKMKAIANHGSLKKYYHKYIGVNSRLDTMQAAILRVKLPLLDKHIEYRRKAAQYYDSKLSRCSSFTVPYRDKNAYHTFNQYTVQINNVNRDCLINYLKSKKIPAMVYYPLPLHLQEAFGYLNYKKGDFPVTEELCNTVFSLPMHPDLMPEHLDTIAEAVLQFCET